MMSIIFMSDVGRQGRVPFYAPRGNVINGSRPDGSGSSAVSIEMPAKSLAGLRRRRTAWL
jgi:hypothetical protein